MGVAPISIDAVPEYKSLNSENADFYYKAGQRSAFIYGEVINPFETSLKESTGYSDDNIPDEEREIFQELGEHRFLLRATPTKKRPGYREVVRELVDFLKTRLDEYSAGERPVGVITIDDEPYIYLDNTLTKLRNSKETVISKGVKLSIAETPGLPVELSSMVVPLGMDMSGLTEGNASRYLEALRMQEGYGRFISAFESELLGLTGFSDENPPEQTEHMYKRLGEHIFHIRSVPYTNTSWGKVYSGLDKEPPKRKPENGGDLTLIEMGIEVPRLEVYRTRRREGEPLIQLNSLLSRIEELVEEHTDIRLRQKPINHYPIV